MPYVHIWQSNELVGDSRNTSKYITINEKQIPFLKLFCAIARFTNTGAVSERYKTGLGTGILVEFELMGVWLRKSIKYRIQRSRLRPSSKDEAETPTTSLGLVFCSQIQTCLDVFNDVQPTSQRFANTKSLLKYYLLFTCYRFLRSSNPLWRTFPSVHSKQNTKHTIYNILVT